MTSEDNEYFLEHIKDAVRTLRLGCVCVCFFKFVLVAIEKIIYVS